MPSYTKKDERPDFWRMVRTQLITCTQAALQQFAPLPMPAGLPQCRRAAVARCLSGTASLPDAVQCPQRDDRREASVPAPGAVTPLPGACALWCRGRRCRAVFPLLISATLIDLFQVLVNAFYEWLKQKDGTKQASGGGSGRQWAGVWLRSRPAGALACWPRFHGSKVQVPSLLFLVQPYHIYLAPPKQEAAAAGSSSGSSSSSQGEEGPMVFAGLFDVWDGPEGPMHTYTILTTGAPAASIVLMIC